jgi:hypothetical protein
MIAQAKRYFLSPSTAVAACIGALMYFSYACIHSAWNNPTLVATTVFIGMFLPTYFKLSNRAEEVINLRFATVTFGRIGRLLPQFIFNLTVFWIFLRGGVMTDNALEGVGGLVGVALLTTLASQGAQYAALIMYNRGIGDPNRNVLLALSTNAVVTALATTGIPYVKPLFLASSLVFGGFVLGVGILSDLRGRFYPQRGVGMFFGTFNPFHITHTEIIRKALEDRKLDKIFIHPTITPKLHSRALEKGEIEIVTNDGGLDVLQRTPKADANVNYFPTGNRFYPPQTRRLLIELALMEAGLADKVEVLWFPEIYHDHGFHGVIEEVRKRNPGAVLHGLHSSDLGGMWVRSIYDECGWIFPMPIRRRNKVSATAIRKGAQGMTATYVDEILTYLRSGISSFSVNERKFRNTNGIIEALD